MKSYVFAGGIIIGLLCSGAVFADNTDVVDEINITVPVSCTMSGTGMTSHTATIPNGIYSGTYTDPDTSTSYANGIGTTTLKAFCNDQNGFSIYAIGYTDNIDGKNVLTSSTLGSTYDIVTGTNTGPVGNTDTSNWSMKLATVTSPAPTYPIIIAGSTDDTDKEQGDLDYSSFQEIPDDYTKVAYRKASTDVGQDSVGAELTTTYAVYISKTQPASTYTGQVKYILVHPHNGTAPEKPLGLCQSIDTCMQQQTSASLAQKLPNIGDTTTLYDARDNQAYTVAKLADGKYWMTENLNIAGGTALSSEDTDFDASYTLPTTNGWTVTDGKLILPASSTSGFSTDNYAFVYNSGNKTSNCASPGCYSYYSWYAVTLGSGRSMNTDNTDASYSICPKNWRLPTTRTTDAINWQTESDFYALAHQYGLDSTTSISESDNGFYTQAGPGTTPDFLLAGYYNGGSFYSGGSYGGYWSATSFSSSTSARYLAFNSGNVYSAAINNRRYGYSVRCLFGS